MPRNNSPSVRDIAPYAEEIKRELRRDQLEDSGTFTAEIGNPAHIAEPEFQWPELIPFDAPIETEEFNLDVLPEPVRDFCKAVCTSLNVRPGMVGPIALGCLATIYQRRYMVKDTFEQPLQLFTIVSAPPSAGKSPVFSLLLNPFREWERERQKAEKPAIAAEQSELRMLKNKLSAAEKAAVDDMDSEMEARRIAEELSDREPTHETVLFTADCTEEALVMLLEEQSGKLTLASAEGGFLANLKGRYKAAPDIDAILQAYSGEEIRLNRISRGSTILRDPRLSVILCCQPSSLSSFLNDDYMHERGMVSRFLLSQPRGADGILTIDTPPVPEDIAAKYRDFIFHELDDEEEGVMVLSAEAHSVFVEAADLVLNESKDEPENLATWDGKHRGNLLRICGLLHASWDDQPVKNLVPASVVYGAWEIMNYFRAQYFALMSQVGQSEAERNAKYLLGKLNGVPQITKRDLHQKCKSKIRKAESMEAPLRELEERGYITTETKRTGGRSSEIIHVNPRIHSQSQKQQNAQKIPF